MISGQIQKKLEKRGITVSLSMVPWRYKITLLAVDSLASLSFKLEILRCSKPSTVHSHNERIEIICFVKGSERWTNTLETANSVRSKTVLSVKMNVVVPSMGSIWTHYTVRHFRSGIKNAANFRSSSLGNNAQNITKRCLNFRAKFLQKFTRTKNEIIYSNTNPM